jgi:hypothetical protein
VVYVSLIYVLVGRCLVQISAGYWLCQTANFWFYQVALMFGGKIAPAVLVNTAIILQFFLEMLECYLRMHLENLNDCIRLFLEKFTAIKPVS